MTGTEVKQPQDFKRGKKKPNVKVAYICNDPDLGDEYEAVKKDLDYYTKLAEVGKLTTAMVIKTEGLREQERDLSQKVKENSLKFTFRGIGMKRFDNLVEEHPPLDEQIEKMQAAGLGAMALRFNPLTFAPALCQACLVEPEEDITGYWDSEDWNGIELGELFNAALEANTTRRIIPSGNA